jgi:isoquinoline 1-oxidoreductase alpha subunit
LPHPFELEQTALDMSAICLEEYMQLSLNVNGVTHEVTVNDPSMPLLWVLRDILGLTGTKYGCGIEVCGACTVLVNGHPEKTCQMDVQGAQGKAITTIEGLSPDGASHPLQKAWIQLQVPQCGYCQSGMIMAATDSLNGGDPVSNICVCGTYQRVRDGIKLAATL